MSGASPGSGSGDWQIEAERAAHWCDLASTELYALVLNPDRSDTVVRLKAAHDELGRAVASIEAAIALAEGDRHD